MKMKYQWIIALIVSSLFFITAVSVKATPDVTITDGTNDVTTTDFNTGENIVVTSSPYINVNSLDITEATYAVQGSHVTLTLVVNGDIVNRGSIITNLPDTAVFVDSVQYDFTLTTSHETYAVSYANKTCELSYGNKNINLTSSDFSYVGNTLSVSFSLSTTNETYDSLDVMSNYLRADLYANDTNGLVDLTDVAPNPPLAVVDASSVYNTGSVGDSIQFNGTVDTMSGEPPYTYHWDFGDHGTSTKLNPTHTYTKAGIYTYNFTVTDHADATAFQTGIITITKEGGGGSGGLSTQMIMFLAILLIIIVIGVVTIVWIVRRR